MTPCNQCAVLANRPTTDRGHPDLVTIMPKPGLVLDECDDEDLLQIKQASCRTCATNWTRDDCGLWWRTAGPELPDGYLRALAPLIMRGGCGKTIVQQYVDGWSIAMETHKKVLCPFCFAEDRESRCSVVNIMQPYDIVACRNCSAVMHVRTADMLATKS